MILDETSKVYKKEKEMKKGLSIVVYVTVNQYFHIFGIISFLLCVFTICLEIILQIEYCIRACFHDKSY